MSLFKSKDEIPKIPSAPVLPSLPPKEEVKVAELPSIPGNMTNDNFNQEMIKSAISDTEKREDSMDAIKEEIEELPKLPSTQEIETDFTPSSKKAIFVKIDKFNKAQSALRDIEVNVREISSEIKSLKEIKTREIKELDLWDEELKKINARLSRIDSNIFGER
jgi:hypothetical protein